MPARVDAKTVTAVERKVGGFKLCRIRDCRGRRLELLDL
jgi:hypothetical protein